ncbi:MAG: hypothetical protein LBU76_03005 [Azoarcus sp.]|nr:hypothetical protein [Azoarcus sp.]
MKTAILTLTLLAATTVCLAQQNKTQTMLEKENLKGKVKSVYMTNGSDYIKTWFDETGKRTRAEMKYLSNPLFIEDNYIYMIATLA